MATNNFKPFALANGANVTSQADYELLDALLTGFQSGKASSPQINKALRQSSVMASVLAQFISDSAAVDVLDNGNPAQILSSLKAAMTALTPGRLIGPPQIFTSSGIYTPSNGTKQIIVELIGGGGGGGGCFATASGQSSVGSSGSGGGYARKFIKSNFAGVLVTIGTGGTSGVAVGGGQGGTTSFGSIFYATGGFGGVALPAQTTFPTGAGTNPPGQGYNGDVNANGEWAQPSIIYSPTSQHVGNSGGCFLGGGVRVNSDSVAANGLPGTGGTGVARSPQLTALAGGLGGNGMAFMWEYA